MAGRSVDGSGWRRPQADDAEYLINCERNDGEHQVAFDFDRAAHAQKPGAELVLRSLPIRLTQHPTRCRVYPVAGIKLGKGWRLHSARHSEQRAERVEWVEATVEAECKFVEVGL